MNIRRGLLAAVLLPACILLASCGNDDESRPEFSDEDFPLDEMVLRLPDIPAGMIELGDQSFDNAEAAETFTPEGEDVEARERQLEAQGRIRSHVSVFGWEQPVQHLGRISNIFSQSTLFTDEESADRSLLAFCDLQQYDPAQTTNVRTFTVPRIGDNATGLEIRLEQEQLGETVDTIICFRTGRAVHSVVASGFEGTQDLIVSLQLARVLMRRIDLAYAGYDFDVDDDDAEDEGG